MTDGHGGHGHDGHHDHGSHGGKSCAFGIYDMPFSGHHAGQATFDAIMVGHDFGGHSFGVNVDSSVSSHGFHAGPGTMEGNGPSFGGPLDLNQTDFGVLVVGMGACNWESVLRQTALKLGLVECFNLQLQNPIVIPPRRYDEILPINYRPAPAKVVNPQFPKGAFAGAVGATTLSRTNWQIGERSALGRLIGSTPTRKTGVRVNLEVEVTVWFFAEPGDYEIRLVVRAFGRKENPEMPALLKAARTLTQTMLEAFKRTPPSADAARWRREHVTA
jgi:hypothetical protein